jgi:hypothetical protein
MISFCVLVLLLLGDFLTETDASNSLSVKKVGDFFHISSSCFEDVCDSTAEYITNIEGWAYLSIKSTLPTSFEDQVIKMQAAGIAEVRKKINSSSYV